MTLFMSDLLFKVTLGTFRGVAGFRARDTLNTDKNLKLLGGLPVENYPPYIIFKEPDILVNSL